MVEKSTSARAVSLPGLRDGWYLPIGLALIAVGIVLMGRKIYLDQTWPAGTDISVYLSALKNIAAGLHPYGDVHAHPFAYPPLFSELLSLLFPFFSDGKWWAVWSALTFVQLIAALIIMMRGFGEKLSWGAVALICGVISVSHLTRSEVFHGQADFTILLLLVLGLRFSTLQRPFATAVAWSIMMNIKPFLGIVVVHQLVTRRYKEAVYTLIAGGSIFALSFAVFGTDAIDAFLKWRASAAWYTSVPGDCAVRQPGLLCVLCANLQRDRVRRSSRQLPKRGAVPHAPGFCRGIGRYRSHRPIGDGAVACKLPQADT